MPLDNTRVSDDWKLGLQSAKPAWRHGEDNMLSNSIATFVRVTPPPKTLAESSAVFKRLKEYGRVTSFARGPSQFRRNDSSLYYAVLANPSPKLNRPLTFDVPIYHNQRDPKDEDPFNIRGLQDRKPWPEACTLTCNVEQIDEDQRTQVEDYLKSKNPYACQFHTVAEKYDRLQAVLRDTKAPLPVINGLGRMSAFHRKGKLHRIADGETKASDALTQEDDRAGQEGNINEATDNIASNNLTSVNSSSVSSGRRVSRPSQIRKLASTIRNPLPSKMLKPSQSEHQ